MAKRFTDTNKWDDAWFCALNPNDKLFWSYLCDKCDHAGIWKVNIPLAKFHIGADYEPDPTRFGGRIQVLAKDKWYIHKFVAFQYGELNTKNNVHRSVLAILKKEGVTQVLARSSPGPKDKETDKEKDKDKDKDKEKGGANKRFIRPELEEVKKYCDERRNGINPQAFLDHYDANGWKRGKTPIKDWKACVRTWEQKRRDEAPGRQPAKRTGAWAKPSPEAV